MDNKKALTTEVAYATDLLKKIQNESIRARVENLLLWYIDSAKKNKTYFYFLSVISLICSSIIPILSLGNQSCPTNALIISIIAAVGGLATSFVTLFHVKDNWTRYRMYAELLKSECFRFINNIDEYNTKESEVYFIKNVELLAAQESKKWSLLQEIKINFKDGQ